MKLPLLTGAGILALIILSGCFTQIARPTDLPTPSPTPEGPAPTSTLELPTPTPTLVPADPDPTPTSTPVPTAAPGQPLFLEILQPTNDITVLTRNITVSGKTVPGAFVTVDNRRASVDANGEFNAETFLSEGLNVVEVITTGPSGNRLREFLTVTFVRPTPRPFALEVTDPLNNVVVADEFIAVGGRTLPRASVVVNGVGVSVDDDGDFSTAVRLTRGVNTIEVVARNTDGSVLRVSRTVIFAP